MFFVETLAGEKKGKANEERSQSQRPCCRAVCEVWIRDWG